MFSNPPHDLAAAATIAATLHNPTKLCLTSRNLMVYKCAVLPSAADFVWRVDAG